MAKEILLCVDCEGTREQLERLWSVFAPRPIDVTFFFVGQTARAFPDVAREVGRRHQVESHTETHANLRRLGREAQRREILEGKRSVEEILGRPTCGFRAPCHMLNADTVSILREEAFVFDVSTLYFRYRLDPVITLRPTWFREWTGLHQCLHVSPRAAFALLKVLVALSPRRAILAIHPHYSGMNDAMAAAFGAFLDWGLARNHEFLNFETALLRDGRWPAHAPRLEARRPSEA